MKTFNEQQIPIYIGTYTRRESFVDGKGEGIYVYLLDLNSGNLTHISTMSGVVNPSYLTFAPGYNYLYAVNEIAGGTEGSGSLSAFAVDHSTKDLIFLNSQSTLGLSPCHVSIDSSGRFALVANYGSGSLCVLPLLEDGSLGEATQLVEHHGFGPNAERQEGPHAHMITPSPDGRFIVAVDLGTDEILVYRLDKNLGKLIPIETSSTHLTPGTGPRHIAFHPNAHFAYVISELKSKIITFEYDSESGKFSEKQALSTLPNGYTGQNQGAEIELHPSGMFVYASNRGHDSIAIYAVDRDNGELSYLNHESTQGIAPRYFCIDPTGTLLLVANQDSETIVTFHIDQDSGELEWKNVTKVPTPVCIQFYQG
jgi:6-phosphogluconolactonase